MFNDKFNRILTLEIEESFDAKQTTIICDTWQENKQKLAQVISEEIAKNEICFVSFSITWFWSFFQTLTDAKTQTMGYIWIWI
jgi:hypothetical protein